MAKSRKRKNSIVQFRNPVKIQLGKLCPTCKKRYMNPFTHTCKLTLKQFNAARNKRNK